MAFSLQMKQFWKIILYPIWLIDHIGCMYCMLEDKKKRRKVERRQRKDDYSCVYSETTLVKEGAD